MRALRRWLIRLATAAVIVYAALLLFLFFVQRDLMYPAGTTPPDAGSAGFAGLVETVQLTTADGLRLLSWYRAPRTATSPVVIYFHGNGGTIAHRGPAVRPFIDAGYCVLLLEYRGYGGDPGSPTEEGLYADGRAALGFVDAEGIPVGRQILYGESLGTGVAVQMAHERGAGALVLASPYTSIADVAQPRFPFVPVRLLLRDRFESDEKIGALRMPIMVLHGKRDDTIPVDLGIALYEMAPEPKAIELVPKAGHNNLNRFGVAVAILGFLRQHGLGPQPGSPGAAENTP